MASCILNFFSRLAARLRVLPEIISVLGAKNIATLLLTVFINVSGNAFLIRIS
jgi:hypothetical protein